LRVHFAGSITSARNPLPARAPGLHLGVGVSYNFWWKAPLFRQTHCTELRSGGVPRANAMEVRCQRH
jgi:hypothetical protein